MTAKPKRGTIAVDLLGRCRVDWLECRPLVEEFLELEEDDPAHFRRCAELARTILPAATDMLEALVDAGQAPEIRLHFADLIEVLARSVAKWGEMQADPAFLQYALDAYAATWLVMTYADRPAQWAMVHNNRASVLGNLARITGRRQEFLEALAAYDAALEVQTFERDARGWAMIQMNRASTMASLIGMEDGEEDWAAFKRVEAIYGEILERIPFQILPELCMSVRSNRAALLCQIAAQGNSDRDALHRAVADSDAVLSAVSRQTDPVKWANAANNRASALAGLGALAAGGEQRSWWLEALAQYDAILRIFTRENTPAKWAMVQGHRADLLRSLGQMDGGDDGRACLRDAIEACDRALDVTDRQTHRAGWVFIQRIRASTLVALGEMTGEAEGCGRIRDAVVILEDTLTATLQDETSIDWARGHSCRGTALLTLGEMVDGRERERLLRQAVESYDAALTVYRQDSRSADWGMVQMNRATVLFRLGEQKSGSAGLTFLKMALAGYDLALTVTDRETMPVGWAAIQKNRGSVLFRLGQRKAGDDGTVLLEQAISAFDIALQLAPRNSLPLPWQRTVINQISTLTDLAERKTGAERRQLLQQVLNSNAILCADLERSGHSGNLISAIRSGVEARLLQEDWSGCAETALIALERANSWLLEASTAAEAVDRINRLTGLGDMAGFALARMNRGAEAVLAVEAGRAHFLREHLRLAEAALNEEDRERLDDCRRRLHEARRELERRQSSWATAADAAGRATAHVGLEKPMEEIAAIYREFVALLDRCGLNRPFPLAFDSIVAAADIGTPGAAVVISTTAMGTAFLAIPNGATHPDQILRRLVPGFTEKDLERLLVNDDGDGWMNEYTAFVADLNRTAGRGSEEGGAAWNRCVSSTLERLWRDMMEPLDRMLKDMGLEPGASVTLIAPGRLAVLPLHAAGQRDGNGCWTCMFDNWNLSYSPSVMALARTGRRTSAGQMNPDLLLAVTDPLRDLSIDPNPAAALFAAEQVDDHQGSRATLARIRGKLSSCTYASFMCHGLWDPQDHNRSGLVLARRELLTAGDLRAAGMERCRFAVLGACMSGLASVERTPDEFLGLPTAFLQAGVGAVAASFWPVFNTTLSALVHDIFLNLRGLGLEPAEALRRAQQRLRNGHGGRSDAVCPQAASVPIAAVWDEELEAEDRGGDSAVTSALTMDLAQPIHWAVIGLFGR